MGFCGRRRGATREVAAAAPLGAHPHLLFRAFSVQRLAQAIQSFLHPLWQLIVPATLLVCHGAADSRRQWWAAAWRRRGARRRRRRGGGWQQRAPLAPGTPARGCTAPWRTARGQAGFCARANTRPASSPKAGRVAFSTLRHRRAMDLVVAVWAPVARPRRPCCACGGRRWRRRSRTGSSRADWGCPRAGFSMEQCCIRATEAGWSLAACAAVPAPRESGKSCSHAVPGCSSILWMQGSDASGVMESGLL